MQLKTALEQKEPKKAQVRAAPSSSMVAAEACGQRCVMRVLLGGGGVEAVSCQYCEREGAA